MNALVKIVVAEPSVIIRSGIHSIMKKIPDIHIEVFEIFDMDQLKDSLSWHNPDILIVNPNFLGLFSLQQIKKETKDTSLKFIALQSTITDNSVLKDYDEVISIYDSADQIKDKLSKLIENPEPQKRQETLSNREKEVIACIVKGMTNKQIADQLCLSTHTVMTHRRNISSKLQIHSPAGLTIYAIVNKLVELDDLSNPANE